MQRLYSMFPVGGPGIGLVSLRFALVVGLYVDRFPLLKVLPGEIAIPALIVLALAILLGILTPVFATFGFLAGCLAIVQASITQTWIATMILMIAMALLLLGPGAYSLDASIYGRRIISPNRKKGR